MHMASRVNTDGSLLGVRHGTNTLVYVNLNLTHEVGIPLWVVPQTGVVLTGGIDGVVEPIFIHRVVDRFSGREYWDRSNWAGNREDRINTLKAVMRQTQNAQDAAADMTQNAGTWDGDPQHLCFECRFPLRCTLQFRGKLLCGSLCMFALKFHL